MEKRKIRILANKWTINTIDVPLFENLLILVVNLYKSI